MRFNFFGTLRQITKTAASHPLGWGLVFAVASSPLLGGCIAPSSANNGPGPVAAAQLEVTPASITFSSAIVGVQNSQTLKLTNSGGTAMTVTGIIASGTGLSVNGFSGSTMLNPGTSATFGVQLTPKNSGTVSGTVSILSSTSALDTTLSVSADVASAHLGISVAPSSLNFGSVSEGKSASQTVTLTNTGNAEITVSQILLNGAGFSMSGGSAPMQLASAQGVTLDLQFSPSASGTSNGTLTVLSNAGDSSVTVNLSGSGVDGSKPQISVGPASVNFGSVSAGKSASQTVTLTNTGNTELTVSRILLNGAGFTMSGGGAPIQLASAQDVTLALQFSPSAAGITNGTLTVDSNASDSSVVVKLSGSETAPAAPASEEHSVGLTWDASTSAGITGYNVYRSGSQQGPFSRLNGSLVSGLSYTDDAVSAGDTYYYVTTAVDSQGEESPYSNWAKAVVP